MHSICFHHFIDLVMGLWWVCSVSLFPLSHGRNFVNFICINNSKLSSGWKRMQLSSRGASKYRHVRMLGSVVIKVVAKITPVENAIPIFQEEDVNIDDRVQSRLDRIYVDNVEEMPSKEYERRLRISNANKGKVPWNKGGKHSPSKFLHIASNLQNTCVCICMFE